nr:retrovirus-related Pol polyprotein from transposon TNT 1-94 [Tanacetum cinerariifolium]
IDNTKTQRPQPRSNTKNDRVPSTSKSSQSKNKEVDVEEHHRKLVLSRNKKHMSPECNNVKLATQNGKSKVVCAMCKQCVISVNHDVCLLNYVNGMTSRVFGTVRFENDHIAAILGFGDLQWENILITRVYFVEGLGHNLFSVGKFCDSDLEEKSKRASHPPKHVPNSRQRLHLLHMDLCGPMRISSINGKRALCYPKNDREDIGKLGATGDIGFFIGYSADSCTYRVFNRRTKKIMETMNVSFYELSAMAFEQRSSKHGLFVEGLGHNLFSVGKFCDSDLEVALRRNTCFIRNIEGVDLLKGNRTTNLYTINLYEIDSASPICLMDRTTSTKSWLWHQLLSHLNFDTLNDLVKNDLVTGLPKFKYHKEHLFSSCEQGKKQKSISPTQTCSKF